MRFIRITHLSLKRVFLAIIYFLPVSKLNINKFKYLQMKKNKKIKWKEKNLGWDWKKFPYFSTTNICQREVLIVFSLC